MKKQILIPLAILATLAIPGIAQAHNATATPTCSGLAWSATNYDKTVTNKIIVRVDDANVYSDLDFKASDTGSLAWSQTEAHTWSVVVNAPGTQYDKSFSGTWQACQTAPTTTTVAPTTTTVTYDTTPTTVVEPTTTSVVEVGEPPVPTTTLAPAGRSEPICEPDMPCWPCRDYPGYVCPIAAGDVVSLTPVEPVLPVTGGVDWIIIAVAGGIIIVGVFLVRRGRRVG